MHTSNITTIELWGCSLVTVLIGNKITRDGLCMYRKPAMGFFAAHGFGNTDKMWVERVKKVLGLLHDIQKQRKNLEWEGSLPSFCFLTSLMFFCSLLIAQNFYSLDTLLDTSPNDLRGHSEHLELVDAAFFFETSCPPLMRPERKVDVIIHLNYTGGSQTLVRNKKCHCLIMVFCLLFSTLGQASIKCY